MYAAQKFLRVKLTLPEQFQFQVTKHQGRSLRMLVEDIELELGKEDPAVYLGGWLLRGREVLGPHRQAVGLADLPEGIVRDLTRLI